MRRNRRGYPYYLLFVAQGHTMKAKTIYWGEGEYVVSVYHGKMNIGMGWSIVTGTMSKKRAEQLCEDIIQGIHKPNLPFEIESS